MFTALTEKGGVIHITSAKDNREEKYFCPGCGKEVIIKKIGDTHFFSHKAYSSCKYDEEDAKWVKEWEKNFDPESINKEVSYTFKKITPYAERLGFQADKEYRYTANAIIGKTVLVLCGCPIANKEFLRQNYLFNAAGYGVVWVVNMRGFCLDGKISVQKEYKEKGNTMYRIETSVNMFTGSYLPSKKNPVYFEMEHGLWERYTSIWNKERIFDKTGKPFLTKIIWSERDDNERCKKFRKFIGSPHLQRRVLVYGMSRPSS